MKLRLGRALGGGRAGLAHRAVACARRAAPYSESRRAHGHSLRAPHGYAVGVAAARTRLGQRHDLLAPPPRLAGGRGLGPALSRAARSARRCRPDQLVAGRARLREHPREKGGAATGPNPTDRAKPGSKRHVVVDARGLPLAALLTAANVTDSVVFEHLLERIPSIRLPYHRRGHP